MLGPDVIRAGGSLEAAPESLDSAYPSAMNWGLLRRARIIASAAIAAAAFSACSSAIESNPEAPETPVVSTAPAPLGTVASVAELQEAFVDAGGDCEGPLEDINRVTAAMGSGVCPDSGTVLALYLDAESAKASVATTMRALDRIGSTMILGDNWSINPAASDREGTAEIAENLGAQMLESEATPVRSLDEAFTLEQAAQAYDEADGTDCANPHDVSGDGSVMECGDLTLIVRADSTLETEALRQMTADALDLKQGGVPIVGRRHIVAVYDKGVDIERVARQIDGVTPSD